MVLIDLQKVINDHKILIKKMPLLGFTDDTIKWRIQGLIGKNNLGMGNVSTTTTRYVLGYYTLYRLLTFRSKLNINLLFHF